MTVLEAERDAAELLEKSWWFWPSDDNRLPIDPFELAKSLGIQVDWDHLPPDESGNIVIPANGGAVITLNVSDHPNRQRFTCAHEIGHYLRRRRQGGQQTFTDYRDTLAGMGRDPEEIYANQFAAALLMPASAVQRLHGRVRSEVLARQFGTSVQAMDVRLRNLRLV